MKKRNLFFPLVYAILFLLGIKALFHGFPDIERFFAEWWDERLTLTYIMKFGTFNFSPTMIMHPPLYHYLTFIPIGIFYVLGKLLGFFHDKIDFARFYFNDTQYFFLIGRAMSYIFYWLAAMVVYKISRLFFNRLVSHLTALAYILIPQFIVEYSTTRPETLLFLNTAIFFYFYLKFYLDNKRAAYLYIASFFLGVSAATKYNALFLGVIFIPLLIYSRKDIFGKNRNKVIPVCLRVGLLVFLGFVLCDPFFVIEFKKFFSNFMALTKDLRQYTAAPGVINIFGHLRELASPAYLNPAGFLVFILGLWALFFRKRILFFASLPALVLFEAYFGINQLAPLRYFNPLMPIAALIFGWGVNLILEKKKFFISILVIFFLLEGYNCFRVWQALSFKPSFTQEARGFIEKNLPEFSRICITANTYIPQLNLTKESYWHLINTAPTVEDIKGYKVDYTKMDDESRYDGAFREIRVESMTKKPQYNIVRWSRSIKTEEQAERFFNDKAIGYIICYGKFPVGKKDISELKNISLVREFKPGNAMVYGRDSLYLYRVNIN